MATRGETRRNVVRGEMPLPDKLEAVPTSENIEPAPIADEPGPAASPTTAPPPPSLASRTFADAMAALRRGDYAGGAEKLERFSKTHASDARTDEADYLRAIALQRAGHRKDAIAAAKRYLATRPNGAHRADAARIAGQ
jgi:TolA-binding protein